MDAKNKEIQNIKKEANKQVEEAQKTAKDAI